MNDDLRDTNSHSFSPEIAEEHFAGTGKAKQQKVMFNMEPQYAPTKQKQRYQNLPQISQQTQSTVVSRIKP